MHCYTWLNETAHLSFLYYSPLVTLVADPCCKNTGRVLPTVPALRSLEVKFLLQNANGSGTEVKEKFSFIPSKTVTEIKSIMKVVL